MLPTHQIPTHTLLVLSLSIFALSHNSYAVSFQGNIETLRFEAKTNIPAVKVIGEVPKTTISLNVDGTELKNAETKIPVDDLKTGMAIRDRHMKERIFQTPDGKFPDIKFVLSGPVKFTAGTETLVKGLLTIRGTEAEFLSKCVFQGEGLTFAAFCKGEVELSKHQIAPPSHLGVKVQPKVTLAFHVRGNGNESKK